MRRKKTDWDKFIERLEAGRVGLRAQLELPPYRDPASTYACLGSTRKFKVKPTKLTSPEPPKLKMRIKPQAPKRNSGSIIVVDTLECKRKHVAKRSRNPGR